MKELTHVDTKGRARMVDVGAKPESVREAAAEGSVLMGRQTARLIMQGGIPKGDVLAVARVAGIMAAKKTPEFVPLCHPLYLTKVEVDLKAQPTKGRVLIRATAATVGRTGVEMEALTAVSAAALAVYDMCKALDKAMSISDITLIKKTKRPLKG